MSVLTFIERYNQARLYARQVRKRREMGDRYDHATPWRRTPTRIWNGPRANLQNLERKPVNA